jgi:AraC-like DNA-binding protein
VATPVEEAATLHFSTDSFPERHRLAGLRDMFGRQISRMDFEPLTPTFHADVTLHMLGSLNLASIDHSLMRASRTRELLVDGEDRLVFSIPGGGCVASQRNREVSIEPGDAVLASNADVGTFTCSSAAGKSTLIGLSRRELLPLLKDFDGALMARIPRTRPAMQLLTGYVRMLEESSPMAPELRQAAIAHVYDLAALALGATGDAAEVAKGRGVRAGRLRAAKAFIADQLGRQDLSAATVAAYLAVTPRYVHMLFETEHLTFSEFVIVQRLARAHAMLTNPRFNDRAISAIAFEAGFNDLSHFNRTFRRHFGATPSQVRGEAGRDTDGVVG